MFKDTRLNFLAGFSTEFGENNTLKNSF